MRFSNAATLLLLGNLTSAEGHRHGSLLVPRRSYQYSRSPVNTVSDILSIPFFGASIPSQMGSMMRQLEAAVDKHDEPKYDVYRNPETNTVELTMEMPGVTAENLSVELEDQNLLRIKGTRHGRQNGKSYKSEIEQDFQLDPDVDPEKLKVSLSAGILRVDAPKKEREIKTLKIQVQEHRDEEEESQPNTEDEVDDLDVSTVSEG